MRFIACSDIHGNVEAVYRMRRMEANEYDAVIVAGDIGSNAEEIFSILDSFLVPVVYIYGNHDFRQEYNKKISKLDHHIHESPMRIGNCVFIGFSGCPTNWGKNPFASVIAQYQNKHTVIFTALTHAKSKKEQRELERSSAYRSACEEGIDLYPGIMRANRQQLLREVQSADGLFPICITHEYLSHAGRDFPTIGLFIHGHVHRFSDRWVRGARILNVSALDLPFTVFPAARERRQNAGDPFLGYKQINAGCYVTFSVELGQIKNVRAHRFGYDEKGWVREPQMRFGGAPFVGADPSSDSIERGLS